MGEFHDLTELALNRDGEAWGNLGYWTGAGHYSQACRALAAALGNAAGLDRDSVLFDAGFGCGDQLLLWLDQYAVADLCGVNISQSQTRLAQDRLEQSGHQAVAASIMQGDVDRPEDWQRAMAGRRLSHVLALDCAYHFPDRRRFHARAADNLPTGGVLALTDFIRPDPEPGSGLRQSILRWMLGQSRIAPANIVDRARYVADLAAAGFANVSIRDISAEVMLGFAVGQRSFAAQASRSLPLRSRIKYAVTARFLHWAHAHALLGYVLVIARKT